MNSYLNGSYVDKKILKLIMKKLPLYQLEIFLEVSVSYIHHGVEFREFLKINQLLVFSAKIFLVTESQTLMQRPKCPGI